MDNRFYEMGEILATEVKSYVDKITQAFDVTLAAQAGAIEALMLKVKRLEESAPDESAIAASVYAQIEIPEAPPAPELPNIEEMVKAEIAKIPVPESPEPPDVNEIIERVLGRIDIPAAPELPNIDEMVTRAVEALPVPEAPEPPDENVIVERVLSKIEVPPAPELPDIEALVKTAVEAIPVPVAPDPLPAPELPDIAAIVKEHVDQIEIPQPEALPDIAKIVDEAVSKRVSDAVSAIPAPKDGEPGEAGRDALQIEILPDIDFSKSYPRGTFATYNGGLWRAYQKTVGAKGWECVVDGTASVSITQDDERHFTIEATKASGEVSGKQFSIPVMIYRDIYSPGKSYSPGDTVTFGGNIWHCFEETRDKPGEPTSKGWRLAVKRGRDARSKA